MNLPIEIINAVQQKNCVLFAGPGFAREAIEALGRDIPDDLMLAKAMGWKRPKRLMGTRKRRDAPDPAIAAEKLLQSEGRAAVLEVIRKVLSLNDLEPTDAHRIGLQHFPLIISTASDGLWVTASKADSSHSIRDRGDDIGDIDENQPSVYHLWGRYSQPERVTLDAGQKPLPPHVTKQLKNLLRRKVIFFVGYRPDENPFEHLRSCSHRSMAESYHGVIWLLLKGGLTITSGKWVWRGF